MEVALPGERELNAIRERTLLNGLVKSAHEHQDRPVRTDKDNKKELRRLRRLRPELNGELLHGANYLKVIRFVPLLFLATSLISKLSDQLRTPTNSGSELLGP